MNAIQKSESVELQDIMKLGAIFKASGYFSDVQAEAQAVVKILYGRELGFSPVVSMMGIHVIEGKPALSSNLMATLIKRSGRYEYKVRFWDSQICVIAFFQKLATGVSIPDDNELPGWMTLGEASFSIEDATRAGVQFKSYKGYPTSWSKYPKAMLFARALSQGLRAYCPDVSASPLYVPEELGAEVNEDGDPLESKKKEPVSQHIETKLSFKKKSAAPNGSADESMKPIQDASEAAETSTVKPEEVRAEGKAIAESSARAVEPFPVVEHEQQWPAPPDGPYISPGQQANFHKEVKKAMPKELLSADKDVRVYQWLLDHGYQKDGVPGAEWLPQAGWLATRDLAIEDLREK